MLLALVACTGVSGLDGAATPTRAPVVSRSAAPEVTTILPPQTAVGAIQTTEEPAPVVAATAAPSAVVATSTPVLTLPPLASAGAVPAVQVRTEFYTDTYRVLANSCQAASDFMRANGPSGWPAETQLLFEFHTPPVTLRFAPNDSGGGVCTKSRFDVAETVLTFTLRITLPEWDAFGQTGCLGAAREWDLVQGALTRHEHGHAERYQARFDEWASKVSGRLAAAQIIACAATPAEATAAAQRQIDDLVHGISQQLQDEITGDPEQERYEQETQHGIKQGAVFHADACSCDQ
jgi:predicted secreted Zn-dependent protease